jgi:hypothetical protein
VAELLSANGVDAADAAIAANTLNAGGADPAADASPAKPLGQRPDAATQQDIALRDVKVLLQPGQWLMEPSIGLDHQENPVQLIGPGGVPLLGTQRYTGTNLSNTLRYGDPWGNELSFGLAGLSERADTVYNGQVGNQASHDANVLVLGFRRQVWDEGSNAPSAIFSLQANIPRDSVAAKTLSTGLTFAKSLDPVVLSASATYQRAIISDETNLMALAARDRLSLVLGSSFIFNDTFAANVSVMGTYSRESVFQAAVIPEAQDYRLTFGFHYGLSSKLSVEPQLSFGIGGTTPAASFSLTFPYTF